MERVVTWDLRENFIDKLTEFILKTFPLKNNDLSRIACVFGGRRPALFLRKSLSQKIKSPFYPPRTFSMDEFVEYLISCEQPLKRIGDLDSAYLIYCLSREIAPSILQGREAFGEFLPWAREINSFIEQLDLEDVPDQSLKSIEKSAEIGYEVPPNINILLQHVIKIRRAYHAQLKKRNEWSRGRMYQEAFRNMKQNSCNEFDAVFFCNFFYLHATEERILSKLYQQGKGFLIFQGSEDAWSVLKKNAQKLEISLMPQEKKEPSYNLAIYEGFDIHSQVCMVRQILNEKVSNKNNTVIILPRPESLIPLLAEVSSSLEELNVSIGYPLMRSSLYVLFDLLIKAQDSKREGRYYSRDYLNLLRHPLVKNLSIVHHPALTRVLIHKIEELLQGAEESSIGGCLFITLEQIHAEDKIYLRSTQTLKSMDIEADIDMLKAVLGEIHALLFDAWEGVSTFLDFSDCLGKLLNVLVEKSMVMCFPLNLKVIEKLYLIKEELQEVSFAKEQFEQRQLWEIFQQKLQGEVIPFIGSPLRGTQILGLLETRSLNFENVIVMDMNESVFPKLKIYEPLIPREVMLMLGLNRLEKEEEIQRYQFMRLISSAENVHLIYEQNQEKEKNRFIEELLWDRQKKTGKLEVLAIPKLSFAMRVSPQKERVKKTAEMVDFLKRQTYSSTRLNTYLRCPLEFYYQYLLGLKEKEDLLGDPQASCVGSFIHELLEQTFKQFKGKKPIINTQFRKYFSHSMEEKFNREIAQRMKSDSLLLKQIIANRLERFLDNEIERNVAKIICLEERKTAQVTLEHHLIPFDYTVDRIDELEDKSIVVIDYKTGGSDIAPKRLMALQQMAMDRESIKKDIKSFQLPLYYHFVSESFPHLEKNAELYNIRTLERKSFIAEGDRDKKDEIMEICLEALGVLFDELFDVNIPFEPDKEERQCQHCSFGRMCV